MKHDVVVIYMNLATALGWFYLYIMNANHGIHSKEY